ncbi:hypothetical protein JK165_07740 [Acetobacter okinawensis]|uniref:hypothetical protein n=1 Tax=Acetobacter okinawensis TaxID=1076594 RepID=UPI001BA7F250|nr:hypothetical protein [Acetobacter okinawensis]MBS0965978.1 hypothetical protein [Acetobacter okinawensis]
MSEKRKLNHSLLVRFDDDLYGRIREQSRQQDVTANSLVRRTMADTLSYPLPPKQSVKAFAPPKPEYIKELYRLRESTAELCGALVQYAIKSRQEGHVMAHAEAESLIPDVREAVRNLDRLRKKLEGK